MAKFQPGQSGNPGGRPKGEGDLRALARARTTEALETLVRVMSNKKAPASAQVTAACAILDRGWGRPVQATAFTDATGELVNPLERFDGFNGRLELGRRVAFTLLRAMEAKKEQAAQLPETRNAK